MNIESEREFFKTGNCKVLPTISKEINKALSYDGKTENGLEAGQFVVIEAPTGTGKTTWLLKHASESIKQGYNTLYITLGEQSVGELLLKMACMNCDLDYRNEYMESYPEDQIATIKEFLFNDNNIKEHFFIKDMDRNLDLEMLNYLITQYQLDFIFIDYLGRVKVNKEENRPEELGNIAFQLHKLSHIRNVGIITAMQTNRLFGSEIKRKDLEFLDINEDFMQDSIEVARNADICLSMFNYKSTFKYHIWALYKNRPTGRRVAVCVETAPKTFDKSFERRADNPKELNSDEYLGSYGSWERTYNEEMLKRKEK